MTSSLVGSEMCIRDRVMTPIQIPTEAPDDRLATAGQFRGDLVACATRTVSYTHLTLPTICSV
eukprot:3505156-Prorocentrum_lima.AAC.1